MAINWLFSLFDICWPLTCCKTIKWQQFALCTIKLKTRRTMLKRLSFGWRFWSRAGSGSISSLVIGIKSIIFIFSQSMTSYQMTNDSKLGIDNIYLDKNWKMLDIVNTAKTVLGLKGLTWLRISFEFEKNIWNESKSWYAFIRRVYNLQLT